MTRRAALTLVEVAIALALFATVLAGAYGALNVAQRAEVATLEGRAAFDAALLQLERRLAAADLDVATAEQGFHVPYQVGEGSVVDLRPASTDFFDPGSDDPTMAGHIRVVRDPDRDDPPSEGLVEIHVIVAWRGGDAMDHRVECVSRLSR